MQAIGRYVVIAFLMFAIFVAAVLRAKSEGRQLQKLKDKVAGHEARDKIVENSNATAEAAAHRSDPGRHSDVSIVPADAGPDWRRGG